MGESPEADKLTVDPNPAPCAGKLGEPFQELPSCDLLFFTVVPGTGAIEIFTQDEVAGMLEARRANLGDFGGTSGGSSKVVLLRVFKFGGWCLSVCEA